MLEELSQIITLTIKLNNFQYTSVNTMKNDSQSYNEAASNYTNFSQGVSMSSRYLDNGTDTTAAFQACDTSLTTKSRTASE
jgi:hypothetical protein